MRFRVRMLLSWMLRTFGICMSGGVGRCAYCGREEKQLYETHGPLGLGGVFVCNECGRACISLIA
jgi:hypothetical protein